MKKILVIGTGGIGSFLVPLLDRMGEYAITVADPDKVEKKNLLYQNFLPLHIGQNKAQCMQDMHINVVNCSRYPILTAKQMEGYDLVVSCVDNLGVRRTLYNTGLKWLDLRAQGRNAALVSHEADVSLYDTLLAGPEGSFSCQANNWDGSGKSVNLMNAMIAGAGAQWIQKYFNDEETKSFMTFNI
tara:strand:- start:22 stop:579 length:558 start_codon:yes stop_codon:yes gene_type:complete